MNLVKIGPLTLNLDRVASLRELCSRGPDGATVAGVIRVQFTDGEHLDIHQGAETLRAWIGAHAQVLVP